MYNKEQLRHIFQSCFNAETWNAVLRNLVKADELRSTPETITDPADCDQGYYLGAKNTADSYRIGLFLYEVQNSNVARKRVGLRNLVRTFINPRWGQFDAALAVFTDGQQWRLSFISDIKGEATSPKRFTFVFGEQDNLYRTAIERFLMLQDKGVTFETLKEAFSVEALSKEFFDQYKEHYLRFCNFIYENADNREWFGQEFAAWNAKEDTQKYIRDYVKNLLGRIVFLQFLQKKGWLGVDANSDKWEGGDTNFMYNLFAKASRIQKENFLDEILEPLFFDCINTPREGDVYDTMVNDIGRVKIPYLNGGLFEEKDIDTPKSVFPAELFRDLFEFFTQYNFTIDENDPNDAEIGVDPEMLGKIFENLLEDNKDKGAFYTPKEIVQYMCRESIDAYLRAHKDDGRTELELLQQVKVCDPAIGSGAFPMGILNELLHRRIALGETVRADIKREIIQQNIYGVDIERGAVDIARLRFWLALVVDSAEPEPLPNLDYKIMQGNSLLEQYKGVDLSQLATQKTEIIGNAQLSFFDDITDVQRRNLQDLLASYYSLHEDKALLREEIKQNVLSQLRESGINTSIIAELAQTDLAANSNFFLWHTWFADVFPNGGFDVVIGNPPYNELRDLTEEEQKLYKKSKFYEFAQGGRVNMYQFFYPLVIRLLNENGIGTLITQNSLLAEESALKNRKLIFSTCNIIKVDSFPERDNVRLRVFESAKMSVCICLLEKSTIYNRPFAVRVWKDKFMSECKINHLTPLEISNIYPDDLIIPICGYNCWNILLKMKAKGHYGISAQAGEIDMTKYKKAFSDNSIFQRVITGAQVLRYHITDSPSQGKVVYLPSNIKLSNDRLESIRNNRIVMQRITGVDSKIRIIATLLEPMRYCANSTNYISPTKNPENIVWLLGILNSKCINFYFKQTSTNTNVTGGEIAKFPIPTATPEQQQPIISLVETILEKKRNGEPTEQEEREIDLLVYRLYGLTYDEVKVIDPDTTITKEEYNGA